VEVGYEGFDLVFSENDDKASSSSLYIQGGELEIPICAREGDFFVEVRFRPALDEDWETAFVSLSFLASTLCQRNILMLSFLVGLRRLGSKAFA